MADGVDDGSAAMLGSVAKPIAWAVNHAHGTTLWDTETKARNVADEWLASGIWVWAEVVPLYRHPPPTLTAAEREAVEQAIDAANGMGQAEPWTMRTLRGLLERLK